jgi:hypothetical protein
MEYGTDLKTCNTESSKLPGVRRRPLSCFRLAYDEFSVGAIRRVYASSRSADMIAKLRDENYMDIMEDYTMNREHETSQ